MKRRLRLRWRRWPGLRWSCWFRWRRMLRRGIGKRRRRRRTLEGWLGLGLEGDFFFRLGFDYDDTGRALLGRIQRAEKRSVMKMRVCLVIAMLAAPVAMVAQGPTAP